MPGGTASPTAPSGRAVPYASDVQATVVLPAVAADLALPSVVVPSSFIPSSGGASVDKVVASVAWRKQVESSGGANAVNGAQVIQVRLTGAASWTDAITVPDNTLATAASATEGGLLIVGDIDLSSIVTAAGTYEFQWADALVDGASLTLHDVQTYLSVSYG